jgi:hypothetical protein
MQANDVPTAIDTGGPHIISWLGVWGFEPRRPAGVVSPSFLDAVHL